jgi:hypothetical protein
MVPAPPDFRRVTPLVETWPAGVALSRVYDNRFDPNAFNPGKGGGGRFHFFTDPAGVVVPALYGSDQEDGALSETVFHDVPVRGPGRIVLESRLDPLSIVALAPGRELRLVQLLGFGLQRLGIRAEQLTSTEAAKYPSTVRWAQALHAALPDADGLVWMSRQFNAARAVALFGDRVDPADLQVLAPPLPLSIGRGRMMVDDAANRAGITIV